MANAPDEVEQDQAAEAPEKLQLEVEIKRRSACERHVTVKVPREDIDRYLDKAYSELMPTVTVPGFRAGRAPRKLVENRFRKEVAEQVKGTLLLDSMTQITEDEKLAAISEPDVDLAAIEIPEDGPLMFEFDLEVRPEFQLPNWKGLKIERPIREFTADDVERQLQNLLAQRGRLVVKEGPAASGDYVATKLTFKHGDEVISSSPEEVIRIRPVLSFRDGKITGFDKLMAGVEPGETREGKAMLTNDAPNVALRGQEVTAVFEVQEVKALKLPELTSELLEDEFGVATVEELRTKVGESLERRLEYHQQQQARQQVLSALTVAADWELPPSLVRRQTQRELNRKVLELRRSGFSEDEIRAYGNELRQNSHAATVHALKEHFILERIAEEEKIEDQPDDYDHEIGLIAEQSGQSLRKVRAQIEKGGMMDALRNQIVERKVIAMILEAAQFKEVPWQPEGLDAEALDTAAGGEDSAEIPEAKYDEGPQPLKLPEERA